MPLIVSGRCASSAMPPLNIVNTTIPVVIQYAIDFFMASPPLHLAAVGVRLWVSVMELTDEGDAVRQAWTASATASSFRARRGDQLDLRARCLWVRIYREAACRGRCFRKPVEMLEARPSYV